MRRRDLIAMFGGAALWPLTAQAQLSRSNMPLVGVLWHGGSAEQEDVYLSVLLKSFRDLGYVEGQNIRFEHRFPAEQPDRFRSLARELVEANCDLIIAVTTLAAVELKRFTKTIPIVFVLVADPVGFGLVDSLANPGGNATGPSHITVDLSGKRIGLLKEAAPSISRIALLVDISDPFRDRAIKTYEAAAAALGLSFTSAQLDAADDIEPIFATMPRDGVDAVTWASGGLLFIERKRIGAAVLAHRLPVVASIAEEVPFGLLMSYGQDLPDLFRRASVYADKILKGAKPAELPVEQPTTFKLVLNLKTATTLGLTVPQALLAQADEVLE
jgi:putative tryptophan/tyrosine transport system substrate-binding protein